MDSVRVLTGEDQTGNRMHTLLKALALLYLGKQDISDLDFKCLHGSP